MNVIRPSEAQYDLMMDELPRVAIVGGKGSGKTFAGTAFMCNMIASYPRSRGLLVWNTLQQAMDIFNQDIKPRLESLSWPYEFNQTSKVLTVFGCEIHIRAAEPDVMKRVESVSFHWGWGDEVSYWPEESFKTFGSRIRLTDWRGSRFVPKLRITSMPDEPDSWLYQRLEQAGYVLHEIGLSANPDKDFVESYTAQLKTMYKDSQLRRYLNGERVSVAGIGIFAIGQDHAVTCAYNPSADIELVWDFNAEFRAVSAWQTIGKHAELLHPVIGCVQDFEMKGATLAEDAQALAEWLRDHKGLIILNGDASGENRQTGVTGSMWKSVREVFISKFGNQARYVVPNANPSVKDTIECTNWALQNRLICFDRLNGRKAFLSLSACKADKYGEIDKSVDYAPGAVRTHHADTVRYKVWREYSRVYPGSRNRYALYV